MFLKPQQDRKEKEFIKNVKNNNKKRNELELNESCYDMHQRLRRSVKKKINQLNKC